MSVRKVRIERLDLRFSAGAMKGADMSLAALNRLSRAVAEQLAMRLESGALRSELTRNIEIPVPAGAVNAGRIAAAIDHSMRGPSTARRQERK
ncbi:MAG: hypothetical protein KGL37_12510 [Acidobacteriota bacterium]|nr:hypothetical protein [Acidobacteriota bacterium]